MNKISQKEYLTDMRNRSGQVKDNSKLVAFLYQILRDHLPSGVVEEIMLKHVTEDECHCTNGWLAEYAQDLAKRLED